MGRKNRARHHPQAPRVSRVLQVTRLVAVCGECESEFEVGVRDPWDAFCLECGVGLCLQCDWKHVVSHSHSTL